MNFRLGGDEEAYNSERPMRADKILRTRGGLVQPKSQGKDSLARFNPSNTADVTDKVWPTHSQLIKVD